MARAARSSTSVTRAGRVGNGRSPVRNRGNAETLRRYWRTGKGGAKIAWGTPGDWTRCYKQTRKYMGVRAKGYCAKRHREVTGVWPGDRRNPGRKKGKKR